MLMKELHRKDYDEYIYVFFLNLQHDLKKNKNRTKYITGHFSYCIHNAFHLVTDLL